ncbi:hypothetical protein J19TS2_06990 [Cohnella xylanilytica]|uniref:COX15/CtaA family protein n=1 Tax=Cohnella xylanilytica TaxID=557555 RepID=UPI001B2EE0E4|nr:COX15/CtaA family protein [Cohnella xylanilytica]GIO11144.1 hypothetical protein J19TS2_06990 [Cohnella xylanilytica]
MTAKRYRLLTLWTCIGMFLVLIVGVVVTNTESGRGCGTDWPLCNGKFVPAYTLESMVEYSHRAVSGIEGLLVGAVFIVTLLMKPSSKEAAIYASGALLFTVAQALLGAAAVIWPTSDAVLAIHFGISMIAFSFTWLLDAWAKRRADAVRSGEEADIRIGKAAQAQAASTANRANRANRGSMAKAANAAPSAKAARAGSPTRTAAAPIPVALFRATVAVIVYCYAVVYLGAYVRHTDSAGGCIGWPLCNGKFVPEMNGATGIVFAHRLAGALLFVLIVLLYFYVRRAAWRTRELGGLANVSLLLVLAQILSGWLLTATLEYHDVYVFTSLLHTIIITALFSSLCLLAIRAWQLSRR